MLWEKTFKYLQFRMWTTEKGSGLFKFPLKFQLAQGVEEVSKMQIKICSKPLPTPLKLISMGLLWAYSTSSQVPGIFSRLLSSSFLHIKACSLTEQKSNGWLSGSWQRSKTSKPQPLEQINPSSLLSGSGPFWEAHESELSLPAAWPLLGGRLVLGRFYSSWERGRHLTSTGMWVHEVILKTKTNTQIKHVETPSSILHWTPSKEKQKSKLGEVARLVVFANNVQSPRLDPQHGLKQAHRHVPIIPVLRRQRQEDQKKVKVINDYAGNLGS